MTAQPPVFPRKQWAIAQTSYFPTFSPGVWCRHNVQLAPPPNLFCKTIHFDRRQADKTCKLVSGLIGHTATAGLYANENRHYGQIRQNYPHTTSMWPSDSSCWTACAAWGHPPWSYWILSMKNWCWISWHVDMRARKRARINPSLLPLWNEVCFRRREFSALRLICSTWRN